MFGDKFLPFVGDFTLIALLSSRYSPSNIHGNPLCVCSQIPRISRCDARCILPRTLWYNWFTTNLSENFFSEMRGFSRFICFLFGKKGYLFKKRWKQFCQKGKTAVKFESNEWAIFRFFGFLLLLSGNCIPIVFSRSAVNKSWSCPVVLTAI